MGVELPTSSVSPTRPYIDFGLVAVEKRREVDNYYRITLRCGCVIGIFQTVFLKDSTNTLGSDEAYDQCTWHNPKIFGQPYDV